jgi:hypothetical protein
LISWNVNLRGFMFTLHRMGLLCSITRHDSAGLILDVFA